MDAVRAIFQEYADSLDVDLEFQNFADELAHLPGEYSAPRGLLLLAEVDGSIAGCCGLRPLDSVDYANAGEMKRLYVRKAFRGFGLGRQLAEAILDAAHQAGYACVLLDTLDGMEAARAVCRTGFYRDTALLPQPGERVALPEGGYRLKLE